MGDQKGYCADIGSAAALGDKEAHDLFRRDCGTAEITYLDISDKVTNDSNFIYRQVIYKSDLPEANIKAKYNKEGFIVGIGFINDSVHNIIDEPARFAEGQIALMRFTHRNTNYPAEARENGIQGVVKLKLTINSFGFIENIEVVKGIRDCRECDREAVRVIKLMPRWKPAKRNGDNVKSYFDFPFSYKIQ
jgi:TonB family protein